MKFIAQNERKITLKESGTFHRVYLKDISFIRIDSYLSIVHFIIEREPIIVSKLLKIFEEELFKYGFIRINQSELVNKVHISSIGNCKNRLISLKEGENLTISHRKYTKVIKYLENH
jgi:DNA-binding LytR/AlgR family response regulator